MSSCCRRWIELGLYTHTDTQETANEREMTFGAGGIIVSYCGRWLEKEVASLMDDAIEIGCYCPAAATTTGLLVVRQDGLARRVVSFLYFTVCGVLFYFCTK